MAKPSKYDRFLNPDIAEAELQVRAAKAKLSAVVAGVQRDCDHEWVLVRPGHVTGEKYWSRYERETRVCLCCGLWVEADGCGFFQDIHERRIMVGDDEAPSFTAKSDEDPLDYRRMP